MIMLIPHGLIRHEHLWVDITDMSDSVRTYLCVGCNEIVTEPMRAEVVELPREHVKTISAKEAYEHGRHGIRG